MASVQDGCRRGPEPKTFGFQRALPPLPVPSLRETCERYLRSVRPLLDDADFARTREAVDEFQRLGGVGEELQAALLARAKKMPNWLEKWREDFTYLAQRKPLVINPNWYALGSPNPFVNNHIEQAAKFISRALEFKKMIDTETLEPQFTDKTVPLCMNQYLRLFSTCRIPGLKKDTLITFGPDVSRHVVVLRNNQFYWFDAYYEDGGILAEEDLTRQLERVVELSERSSSLDLPVGALTTENRTTWAKARKKFIDIHERNKEAIDIIEKSLFVICLDEGNPGSPDTYARAAIHGDGRNRWFDKSFQLIVQKNGQIALNLEHSSVDATIALFMFDSVASGEDSMEEPARTREHNLPPVKKIQWKLTTEISRAIETACLKVDRLIADLDLKVVGFERFGKDFIKKCALSPDAFIQIAIQLAYFKMHAKSALTWEPAHTRRFFHGRTETIRACTMESTEFVNAMEQHGCSDRTRYELLRRAIDVHVRLTREAMNGKGIDRHLFGLRILASKKGLEPPVIFHDKAYRMGWTLSTTQGPMKTGLGIGTGPETDDGYCVGYSVKQDLIYFHITSKKSCPDTDSLRFADSLEQSLLEMQKICASVLS